MIKDLLRIIGCACVIAGTILYFSTDGTTEDTSENSLMKTEIATLESELKATTGELASLQVSLKEAQTPSKEEPEENKEKKETTKIVSDSPPASDKTLFLIERGMDSTRVANELVNAGIIKDASEFEIYLVKNKLAGNIQIGEYELNPSMSNDDIIKIITASNK